MYQEEEKRVKLIKFKSVFNLKMYLFAHLFLHISEKNKKN
jgi:hypothetical protein